MKSHDADQQINGADQEQEYDGEATFLIQCDIAVVPEGVDHVDDQANEDAGSIEEGGQRLGDERHGIEHQSYGGRDHSSIKCITERTTLLVLLALIVSGAGVTVASVKRHHKHQKDDGSEQNTEGSTYSSGSERTLPRQVQFEVHLPTAILRELRKIVGGYIARDAVERAVVSVAELR